MEEITMKYGQFKARMDMELQQAVEGFVRIGYLLKVARDTNVLWESGYKSVAEFAQAEYGLTKDTVSRYIAINDRFAEDGYSEKLRLQYQKIGFAKLGEMLTLSDEVIEAIPLQASRREIQELKREISEEAKITGMEVILEGTNGVQEAMQTNMERFMHQYIYDNPKELPGIIKACGEDGSRSIENILDILAPSGIAMKTVRLQGIGRIMVSIKGKSHPLDLLNVRTNEKETYQWEDFIKVLTSLVRSQNPEECWKVLYEEPYPPAEEEKENLRKQEVEREAEKIRKAEKANETRKTEKANETRKTEKEQKVRETSPSILETNGGENRKVAPVQQPSQSIKETISVLKEPSGQQENKRTEVPGNQDEGEENHNTVCLESVEKKIASDQMEVISEELAADTEELKETDHPNVIEDRIYQLKKEMNQIMERLRSEILEGEWKEARKSVGSLDRALEQLGSEEENDIEGQRTIEEYIQEVEGNG